MQKKDHVLPDLLTSFTDHGRPIPPDEVARRLRAGWRCVRFESCYSFLLATVVRQSPVHLTPHWQSRYWRGVGYSLVSFAVGPWGIPWGPIHTLKAAWTNLTGGVDVTAEVLAHIETAHPHLLG